MYSLFFYKTLNLIHALCMIIQIKLKDWEQQGKWKMIKKIKSKMIILY
jgi:hypothetical protein